METATKKGVPNNVPNKWIVFLAERLTPRHQRDFISGDLLALGLPSGKYLQRAIRWAAGTVIYQMAASFNWWLLAGEAALLWIAFVGFPILPVILLLAILLVVVRVRDAYVYPAEGAVAEMAPELCGIAALMFLAEAALGWMPAPPVFTFKRLLYATIAAAAAVSGWRMVFRRHEPLNGRPRELSQSLIVTWHMNILWSVAGFALSGANVVAVPGADGRDFLLGFLPIVLLGASYGFQGGQWRGKPQRTFEGIFKTREKGLLHDSAVLWHADRSKFARFRPDLCAEVLFFGVLVFPAAEAAWRWFSGDSAAAHVNWRQVAINLVAAVVLAAVWIRIKRCNRVLASALKAEALRVPPRRDE